MNGPMTHLDGDALAEFRAGLITGRRGARIEAHLAGCDRCSARDGQLAEVSALLAAAPVPALPHRVADRLDTVLAAEVAKRNHPERARGDSSPDGASRQRPARAWGFRLVAMRVLAPAGAAVVLAAGGYGLSQIGGHPGTTAASPAMGSTAKSVSRSHGSEIAPAAGVTARPRMIPDNVAVVTSPVNFQPATLRKQLQAQPAAGPTHVASPQVRGCVQKVAGGAPLVRVESAHFEGRPATIIVARTSRGEQVWVTGPGCSATHRDVVYAATL